MKNSTERLLWSIALPGFAQFLNGKLVKGMVFIFLEFLINVNANLNLAIIPSFHGDIETAAKLINYQWLMFYPCLYMFAAWDAYRDAGGNKHTYSYFPFVMATFMGTIGVIYSSTVSIFGYILGPVFLPILFLFIGALIGGLIIVFMRFLGNTAQLKT